MTRGTDRERRVRRGLEADGWVVMRAPGSFGPVDLVALRAGHMPMLIQVKSTAKSPFEKFGPDERDAILYKATQAGAEAWLCWWPPRRQPRWLPSDRWPQPKPVELATPLPL